MSIGEVLAHLRVDFPDVTISKLRFLEAEGLVQPQRTAAGYRKFSGADVARLRYVLTAQRDQYLPLRVIREHLVALDRGEEVPGTPLGGQRMVRPPLSAVGGAQRRCDGEAEADHRLTRAELIARAGLTDTLMADLERYGLVTATAGERYDADALEIAAAAAALASFGVQPRHLRAYRATADREIGLFGQLVTSMARQTGPAARARAAETLSELAALTQRIHAALVRVGLRQTLGR